LVGDDTVVEYDATITGGDIEPASQSRISAQQEQITTAISMMNGTF
jgi:hypothetical protein